MLTIRELQQYMPEFSLELRNPLLQPELGWATITVNQLSLVKNSINLRHKDPGGIFSISEKLLGKATKWCILGNNVIGVTNWEGVDFTSQYDAVHNGAAAFIASAMQYVKIKGPNSGNVLDMLSPRILSNILIDHSRFVLFSNPAGGIDEEALVIRTNQDEFMMSCGGGRIPTWLKIVAKNFEDVEVSEGDIFSFNIKGPNRLAGVCSLIHETDHYKIQQLKAFNSCKVKPLIGRDVRILKTVIGYEVWADAETLRNIWVNIITCKKNIVPCAWDLLNTYRMECNSIVFALYPLDINSSTTFWDVGCGWMVDSSP